MEKFYQLTRTNWHHSDEKDLYYHKTFNFATLKEALQNLLVWADKDAEGRNHENGDEYIDSFGETRQQFIYQDVRDGAAIIEIRKHKWTAENGLVKDEKICRITVTEIVF